MRLKSKRLVSLLLAGSMMVSMVPASAVTAFAAEAKSVAVMAEEDNSCGDGVTYSYDASTKTLTISVTGTGTGAMSDFIVSKTDDNRPWASIATEIKTVKIEEGVTRIGNNAFRSLTALEKTNIPASIKTLGDSIFLFDENLTDVEWAPGFQAPTETTDTDSNYQTYTGAYVPTGMFDCCYKLGDGKELSSWLPSSFKGVGCGAFRGTQFSVDFDNWSNLEYIGSFAFSHMPYVKEFTLTNKITLGLRDETYVQYGQIRSDAFSGSGLEKLTVEGASIPVYFAQNCKNLSTLVINGNVEKIEYAAFVNCSNLSSVTLNGTIGSMGVGVFTNCTAIRTVMLSGPNMKYAQMSTFPNAETLNVQGGDATSVVNAYFSGVNNYNTTLKSVNIDVNSYTGTESPFRNASALESFTLKATTASLDKTAFVGCSGLKTINLSQCDKITYNEGCFGNGLKENAIIYVKGSDAIPPEAVRKENGVTLHGIVAVVNGGTLPETLEEGQLATPEKIGYRFEGWYDNADFTGNAVTTPEVGKTYYANWHEYNAKVDTDEKTDDTKINYVGSPVDIIVNASVDENDLGSVKTADLIFDDIDAVEKVEVNGKELPKPYTGIGIQNLLNPNQAQGIATMAMVNSDPVTLSVNFNTPGEHTVKVVLKDDAGNVVCTSQETTVTVKEKPIDWTPIEKGYYKLSLTDCTAEVDGHKVESGDIVQADKTVTLKLTASVDNMKFNGFVLDPRQDSLKYTSDTTATFTMPSEPVNVTVDLQPEDSDSGIDAATVVTGVAIGAGAAVLTYHIGTELYAEQVLGKGVAVPKTREEVALKAWELAGKPAVAIDGEPLSEAAQAEKWAVESGLMQNDAEGNFNGAKKMNKLKALRVLDKAQKLSNQ